MSSPILQRHRQIIASALMFVVAFAGVVTAAHACSIQNPLSPAMVQAAPLDEAMPEDCAGMANPVGSMANVCESHCVVAWKADAQAEVPAALVAPPQALRIHVADRCLPAATTAVLLSSIGAAPAALLRFARFLI